MTNAQLEPTQGLYLNCSDEPDGNGTGNLEPTQGLYLN